MRPARIGILVHERDGRPFTARYVMRELRRCWLDQGHEVRIIRGVKEPVEADVLLLHVDLTVMPPEYMEYAGRFQVVINGGVLDISKRAVSSNLVRSGDGWGGPVIVKTDLNCGGIPEQVVGGSAVAAVLHRLRRARWWPAGGGRYGRVLDPARYPVFESTGEVPEAIWTDPRLVVERFLPERDGDLYCVRVYLFLGDRGVCTLRKARSPVVKDPTVVHREEVDVPAEILEHRRRLGFDYGKFDFVIHEGRPILLDATRTPVFGGHRLTPGQRARAERITPGLEAWL